MHAPEMISLTEFSQKLFSKRYMDLSIMIETFLLLILSGYKIASNQHIYIYVAGTFTYNVTCPLCYITGRAFVIT